MTANPYFHSFSLHHLPTPLQLAPGEVHLWQIQLDLSVSRVQSLLALLCPEERSRAERFLQVHHQHRFIVGRGILRLLLASYLSLPPTELEFVYGEHGKPSLAASTNHPAIAFNLSHSHNLGLYAIGTDRLLGIDVEQLRPIASLEQLADRFFSSQETAFLVTLPPEQRSIAFLRIWTGKEAYLKATGEGLAGLKQVEVVLSQTKYFSDSALTVGDPPASGTPLIKGGRGDQVLTERDCSQTFDTISLKLQESNQSDRDWTVKQFYPQPDYIATLAVEGHIAELKCYRILDTEF